MVRSTLFRFFDPEKVGERFDYFTKDNRGVLAKKRVARIRRALAEAARRLLVATEFVQRVFRGHQGRLKFARVKAERIAWEKKRNRMAAFIQRVWRGSKVRKQTAARRRAAADRAAAELEAAVKVQGRYRTYRCRKIIGEAAAQRSEMIVAATRIQASYRAMVARVRLQYRRIMMQQEAEEEGTLTLQCWARVLAAVELVDAKRLERDQYQEKLEKAALKVQRCFRGWQSRRRVQEMRANKEEMLRKMIELENWSAVRIQSLFRGYAGRLVAAKALREHKGKWKEMWDQDKSRPFYYNQISGEIRWRKPQALLDLMRRPICHNCEFYEALIECQNCIEFYCNTCWETVHYSGKRRKHKFRSLYDYYEKRVDYGDNEFPSRWPSEVEQDEMVGWQLRIGEEHDRPPDEMRGDWQAYLEGSGAGGEGGGGSSSSGGGGAKQQPGGRTFYYNALTLEGTYEEPPEWRIAAQPPPQQYEEELPEQNEDYAQLPYGSPGGGPQQHHLAHAGGMGQSQSLHFTQSVGSMGAGSKRSVPTVQSGYWSTHFDEAAGLEYYVNDLSGESTYEKPLELMQSAYSSTGGHSGSGGGGFGGSSSGHAYSSGGGAGEWTEQWDDQAQARYWYNSRTQEATWTQPPDVAARPESVA